VFGYALLGSTWLIMKTDGDLQNIAFALTRPLVAVVVAFMGLVSTWLPFLSSQIMARWFESGNFVWLSPVPILALVNAVALWRAVMKRADYLPFILALTFFGLGFMGLLLGMWPNLLPPNLTLWDAAAPPSSQGFVLVGTLIMLPAVLGYTWWSYSVFRGKVAADAGYH
jgi:cytochrome d ubiquinol oxidase subunit II